MPMPIKETVTGIWRKFRNEEPKTETVSCWCSSDALDFAAGATNFETWSAKRLSSLRTFLTPPRLGYRAFTRLQFLSVIPPFVAVFIRWLSYNIPWMGLASAEDPTTQIYYSGPFSNGGLSNADSIIRGLLNTL
jgi:hypothetical protein